MYIVLKQKKHNFENIRGPYDTIIKKIKKVRFNVLKVISNWVKALLEEMASKARKTRHVARGIPPYKGVPDKNPKPADKSHTYDLSRELRKSNANFKLINNYNNSRLLHDQASLTHEITKLNNEKTQFYWKVLTDCLSGIGIVSSGSLVFLIQQGVLGPEDFQKFFGKGPLVVKDQDPQDLRVVVYVPPVIPPHVPEETPIIEKEYPQLEKWMESMAKIRSGHVPRDESVIEVEKVVIPKTSDNSITDID